MTAITITYYGCSTQSATSYTTHFNYHFTKVGFVCFLIKNPSNSMFLPILEEAGIYMKTRFTPLDVEIKWKRDAEVTVVDFKDIGNVNFNSLKKENQYFCQVGIWWKKILNVHCTTYLYDLVHLLKGCPCWNNCVVNKHKLEC